MIETMDERLYQNASLKLEKEIGVLCPVCLKPFLNNYKTPEPVWKVTGVEEDRPTVVPSLLVNSRAMPIIKIERIYNV